MILQDVELRLAEKHDNFKGELLDVQEKTSSHLKEHVSVMERTWDSAIEKVGGQVNELEDKVNNIEATIQDNIIQVIFEMVRRRRSGSKAELDGESHTCRLLELQREDEVLISEDNPVDTNKCEIVDNPDAELNPIGPSQDNERYRNDGEVEESMKENKMDETLLAESSTGCSDMDDNAFTTTCTDDESQVHQSPLKDVCSEPDQENLEEGGNGTGQSFMETSLERFASQNALSELKSLDDHIEKEEEMKEPINRWMQVDRQRSRTPLPRRKTTRLRENSHCHRYTSRSRRRSRRR